MARGNPLHETEPVVLGGFGWICESVERAAGDAGPDSFQFRYDSSLRARVRRVVVGSMSGWASAHSIRLTMPRRAPASRTEGVIR
jgi:hypothetical protein